MIKIGKKGLSILELVVAVGLISIVILFLYRLLIDLNNELTSNDFAINNQSNRFDIISEIRLDLEGEVISQITLSEDKKIIEIYFESGKNSNINISSTENISYKTKDNVNNAWSIKGAMIDYKDTSVCTHEVSSTEKIIEINIPVYTNNDRNSSDNNNALDDIQINYISTYESDNLPSCTK